MPPLEPGDHLDQRTFHRRYRAMPEGTRAELIEGVVYMPSPVTTEHGRKHLDVSGWIWLYTSRTPGVSACTDATVIFPHGAELQPDLVLCLPQGAGGKTRRKGKYLHGAPELVIEVALSTEAIDLHEKKQAYERGGVRAYAVVTLRQKAVAWFRNGPKGFVVCPPSSGGVIRSATFPGLWLDPVALLAGDGGRLREVLEQGLGTPEHADFVAQLKRKRRR